MGTKLSQLDRELLNAARKDNTARVFDLLNMGANILAVEKSGNTTATWLAFGNNGNAVIRLAKIDPAVLDQADKNGLTATHWLATHKDGKTIINLSQMRPSVLEYADLSGFTATLYLALINAKQAVINLAELYPAVLEQADENGWTAASLLGRHDSGDTVIKLADINPSIKRQEIIIELAIVFQHTSLVKRLIKAGFAQPENIDDLLEKRGLSRQDIT